MNKDILRLMTGFRRFREKYFIKETEEGIKYQNLVQSGQSPKTLLIGCSDSRVDPAILTEAAPGELFIVRNVANLVPPCEPPSLNSFHGTSSALEFAVTGLQVENIIILGHRRCGGIKALMNRTDENSVSFIGSWIRIAVDARNRVLAEFPHADAETQWRAAEMEAIKVSIRNLHSFPFVQEAIKARKMNIIGVYFDLELGELWEYDEGANQFRQLEI